MWQLGAALANHMSQKDRTFVHLPPGFYKNKPVSIVSIGMGAPMMDVLVREASYLTDGPLAIVRLGITIKLTCLKVATTLNIAGCRVAIHPRAR